MKNKMKRVGSIGMVIAALLFTKLLSAQTLTIDINEASKGPNPGMIMIKIGRAHV